jgi:cation:H+ antiporter
MMTELLLITLSLGILYFGAEYLVEGASKLAMGLGMSPLLVGLTVVAMGTSAPEFVVSLAAAQGGSPDIAIGNVVGSNIVNFTFILGLAAVIKPVRLDRNIIYRDMPVMIVFGLLAWGACWTGSEIVAWEGGVLLATFLAYTAWSVVASRREARSLEKARLEAGGEAREEVEIEWMKNIGAIVVGLTSLIFGADLMVQNAITLARTAGISEYLIGVTIVAVGTSLPELATSVVAALRGESDISVGNVVGSNTANVGVILGIVALIAPIPVLAPQIVSLDWPFVTAITIVALVVLGPSRMIGRPAGVALMAAYVVYVVLTARGG